MSKSDEIESILQLVFEGKITDKEAMSRLKIDESVFLSAMHSRLFKKVEGTWVKLPDPVYYDLLITASDSETEIWLGDDEGMFCGKGVGVLDSAYTSGEYYVQFGLGTPAYKIEHQGAQSLMEEGIVAKGPSVMPKPSFLDD